MAFELVVSICKASKEFPLLFDLFRLKRGELKAIRVLAEMETLDADWHCILKFEKKQHAFVCL